MDRTQESALNMDLDVLSYANTTVRANFETESIIYLHTREKEENTFLVLNGDPDLMVAGLVALFENVEDSFPLFLDALETYAEEKNINLETYWEELEKKL